MFFSAFVIVVIGSILTTKSEATETAKDRYSLIHVKRLTCDLNDNYWQLINWFFERTTYIEVTEIHRGNKGLSRFSNNIIQQLGQSKN